MPVVRVISALGCEACERVKVRLQEIQARHPELVVDHVDMLTDEGVALSTRHRIWTLPTLVIDDAIVAAAAIAEGYASDAGVVKSFECPVIPLPKGGA
jgi:hypothetical protein